VQSTFVVFIKERLGKEFSDQVRLFNQMRRKIDKVIYEVAGLISKKQAEQAVNCPNAC